MINYIKSKPVTIGLIVLNVVTFLAVYAHVGTLEGSRYSMYLLNTGALFNPFTLDGEWYRLISHMFLHGFILHLVANMYGLFSVGSGLEPQIGSLKFLLLYLICGVAGGLASLYLSVFTVSVGASGAIFGIFGFSIVLNVIDTIETGRSITALVVNFVIFIVIYLLVATQWNVDHAGHFGGLITGASIAALDYFAFRRYNSLTFPVAYGLILLILFFLVPRDQVDYYNFFTKVRHAEQTSRKLFSAEGLSDNDFKVRLNRHREVWDSASLALDSLAYVRPEFHSDTFKLRRYVSLQSLKGEYQLRLVSQEKYILMDSIEHANDSIQAFMKLDFVPPVRGINSITDAPEPPEPEDAPKMVQVWYDSNWVETPYRGAYYRLGIRDSSGQWDGPVRDHYADGTIQMKGVYKKDQRDGIFLYYSHHRTYTAAGRFFENRRVGKWQTFHNNGVLGSEIFYDNGYYMANVWDSTGTPQVINGNGTLIEYYPGGAIKEQGTVLNGRRNGTWTGWFPNGSIHYREEYNNGFIVKGRSQDENGNTYVYDQGAYFPMPEGGYDALRKYLNQAAQKLNRPQTGTVKVNFRVTQDGHLVDFEFEKNVTPEVKEIVRKLLVEGPSWRPAREWGYKPSDGFGDVKIEF